MMLRFRSIVALDTNKFHAPGGEEKYPVKTVILFVQASKMTRILFDKTNNISP